jgi:hypothetical protein
VATLDLLQQFSLKQVVSRPLALFEIRICLPLGSNSSTSSLLKSNSFANSGMQ